MSIPPREAVITLSPYHSEARIEMNKKLTKMIGGVLALMAFREMSVNYGYEAGMKQMLAKQI